MHWYKWQDGTDVTKVTSGHCPEWNGQKPFKSEPLYFHSSRDLEVAELTSRLEYWRDRARELLAATEPKK